jgi:glycosyltransferase involved in cell wall biosynthesis
MRVSIIIPAYNEATRVGDVVRRLLAYGEVLVVDDGSVDATADVARKAGAVVYRHAVNRGQGAALRTGTEAALRRGADVVVHMDADGQHDPDALPKVLAPLAAGRVDIVLGSRFLGEAPQGMPFTRRVLIAGIKQFNVFLLGITAPFSDPQNGLRAMTAAAARALDFRHDRMAHCSEILRLVARSRLRWCEVPVRVRYTPETLAKGQYRGGVLNIVWQLFLDAFRK